MQQPNSSSRVARVILENAGITTRGRIFTQKSTGQRRQIFRVSNPDGLIIKLQSQISSFQPMENEIAILKNLPSRSWAPTLIASGFLDGTGLYSIETMIPGIPLSQAWSLMSAIKQRNAGKKLGEIIKDLHSAKIYKKCGDCLIEFDSIELMLQHKLQTTLVRLKGYLTNQPQVGGIAEQVEEYLLAFVSNSSNSFTPIHNDLQIGNILCTKKSGTITGITDFEMSCKALPAFELLRLYYCTHWPRRFVHNNPDLKECFRGKKLNLLWDGAQETYPELFQSTEEDQLLITLSLLYDLDSLATSLEKNWQRSVTDNINRILFTLTQRQLYAGDGWL